MVSRLAAGGSLTTRPRGTGPRRSRDLFLLVGPAHPKQCPVRVSLDLHPSTQPSSLSKVGASQCLDVYNP